MTIMGNGLRGSAMQNAQNPDQFGFYRPQPTVDEAVQALRKRAQELRTNLASVDAWKAELARLEATLAAWGDK